MPSHDAPRPLDSPGAFNRLSAVIEDAFQFCNLGGSHARYVFDDRTRHNRIFFMPSRRFHDVFGVGIRNARIHHFGNRPDADNRFLFR